MFNLINLNRKLYEIRYASKKSIESPVFKLATGNFVITITILITFIFI